jgi:hypothetical protein
MHLGRRLVWLLTMGLRCMLYEMHLVSKLVAVTLLGVLRCSSSVIVLCFKFPNQTPQLTCLPNEGLHELLQGFSRLSGKGDPGLY